MKQGFGGWLLILLMAGSIQAATLVLPELSCPEQIQVKRREVAWRVWWAQRRGSDLVDKTLLELRNSKLVTGADLATKSFRSPEARRNAYSAWALKYQKHIVRSYTIVANYGLMPHLARLSAIEKLPLYHNVPGQHPSMKHLRTYPTAQWPIAFPQLEPEDTLRTLSDLADLHGALMTWTVRTIFTRRGSPSIAGYFSRFKEEKTLVAETFPSLYAEFTVRVPSSDLP